MLYHLQLTLVKLILSVRYAALFVVLAVFIACGGGTPVVLKTEPTPVVAASNTSTPTPTNIPTVTPTLTRTPTVTPTFTLSPAPTSTATSTSTSIPTPTPTFTPSPVPPTVTPTATDLPTPTAPALTTTPAHRFAPIGPAQPDHSHPCPGCPLAHGYITGRVVDAGGNPLPGVRLLCYNDWHRFPVVASKGSGEYDFPILQAEAVWFVVIVDESDQPLSAETPVSFNPQEACWYRLNWQRMD